MPTSQQQKLKMRILIVSASSRAIAESAIPTGFSVVAVDLFGDWDMRQMLTGSVEKGNSWLQVERFEDVLTQVTLSDFDGILIAGGVENRVDLVREFELRGRLLGPRSKELMRLQSFSGLLRLAEIVEGAGGKFPESRLRFDVDSADADLNHGEIWLVKPLVRCGGRGVEQWMPVGKCLVDAELNQGRALFAEQTATIAEPTFYQRMITGENFSAVFVSVNCNPATHERDVAVVSATTRLIGCSEQLVGMSELAAAEFAYCGSVGPTRLESKTEQVLLKIGSDIADEFGLYGVWGMDFILNEDGIWPVDVNPRIPASAELFELAESAARDSALLMTNRLNRFIGAGLNIVSLHIQACAGQLPELEPVRPRDQIFAKAILFSEQRDSFIIDNDQFEKLKTWYRPLLHPETRQRWLADIPNLGTHINQGDPIVSLFVIAEDHTRARRDLIGFAGELRDWMGI